MTTRVEAADRWVRATRCGGVLAAGIDLLLVGWLVHVADSPLRFPGGASTAIEAVIMLVIYGAAFAALPGRLGEQPATILRIGGIAGGLAGILHVLHMTLENFGARVGEKGGVTPAFMLAAFLIWAVAAYRASRRDGAVVTGIAAGCTSAMWTMVIAVTFGLILARVGIPSADYVTTWDEFKRSGWTDARAFAVANALDAAFGHLAVGLVLGCIFGFFGGVVGSVAARRAR